MKRATRAALRCTAAAPGARVWWRHRYEVAFELSITPTFTEAKENPWQLVIDDHKARRNWQSGVQKVAVLSPLVEKAMEYEQARIKAEANRKRSEAAKGNKNSTGSNQYATKPKEDSDGTDCAATVQTEDARASEKMSSGGGTDCVATKQLRCTAAAPGARVLPGTFGCG